MARTLSAALTAEMNNLDRSPVSALTVERFLPEWTARLAGLSANRYEEFAHGHGAAVAADANGAGEDILLRARSGSWANPKDGKLYVAVLKGSALDAPATWDGLWTDTGRTGLMCPAWTTNSGAEHGGSLAVATFNDGAWKGRVFCLKASGALCYVDVTLSTGAVSGETTIASLGTGAQLASMVLGAAKATEVFVLIPQQLEASLAAWHQPVYGSFIRRYHYTTSWQTDNSFYLRNFAEAGLLRDGPDHGSAFGDSAAGGLVSQWGKRPGGGLAVSELDSNTVLVTLGLTWWRRWGYDTHFGGLLSFIYRRDSGFWEYGPEADRIDFNEATRLRAAVFVRGCQVEGVNFITWVRLAEPSDYEQADSAPAIPRTPEVVWAKVSPEGREWSGFQYLGRPDELAGAVLAAVNHGGGKKLYALGWRSVVESEPAAAVCAVPAPLNLGDDAASWEQTVNNRGEMSLSARLLEPAIVTAAGAVAKSGALVRGYHGIAAEVVQTAQGYIDLITPNLAAANNGLTEGVTLNARADKMLLDVRAESVEEVLPQTLIDIAPDDPITHVALSKGVWGLEPMQWPEYHFAGQYPGLQNRPAWRLGSFPFALTGADLLPKLRGTWFKDITWLELPSRVDGAIQATVRFGDCYNQGNFSVKATDGNTLNAAITRTNGVITTITWTAPGYSNPVAQYAVMGGLICHAAEVGRKYAFVWEHQSNFALSSHTDDTASGENFDRADYSAHGTGSNKLYLIVSDYDGANWINQSVAGGLTATGLTPGKPADLRLQVVGSSIYCFYRAYAEGTVNQWRFAFKYDAGRIGAGRFGLVGRGHAGIIWNVLKAGEAKIARTINKVDFCNIRLSDGARDVTLEEHLRRLAWRGFTPTQFERKVDEASRAVSAGAVHNYALPAENVCLDCAVSVPTGGNEAGVLVRGVSAVTPANDCIRLGLVPHGTANSAANEVNYYVVKRRYAGGAEVTAAREYAPLPIQIKPGVAIPVRVTAVGPVYSFWIAGSYAGHFIDETELGLYFGLYAVGGTGTFTAIRVPELYEIPAYGLVKANETMLDGIETVLARRRVKGIFQPDGTMKFSYFETHPTGPALADTLSRSSYQRNDRFYSVVRVEGADNFAVYTSAALLRRGRRFSLVRNEAITRREFAYREAQAIAREVAEKQATATLAGLPDLRVQPEDDLTVVVSRQNIAGSFLVDQVTLSFDLAGATSEMTLTTREAVAL